MAGNNTTKRVTLYARSRLPEVAARRRDELATRLKSLADEGHVSTVEIHTWPNKVPLESDRTDVQRYERFSEWAAEAGVELDPFFDDRECYSKETGERGEWLVLPALCLVIHRDGDLQSVYPHSTASGSRSVMDCLDALESGRRGPDRHERTVAVLEPAE